MEGVSCKNNHNLCFTPSEFIQRVIFYQLHAGPRDLRPGGRRFTQRRTRPLLGQLLTLAVPGTARSRSVHRMTRQVEATRVRPQARSTIHPCTATEIRDGVAAGDGANPVGQGVDGVLQHGAKVHHILRRRGRPADTVVAVDRQSEPLAVALHRRERPARSQRMHANAVGAASIRGGSIVVVAASANRGGGDLRVNAGARCRVAGIRGVDVAVIAVLGGAGAAGSLDAGVEGTRVVVVAFDRDGRASSLQAAVVVRAAIAVRALRAVAAGAELVIRDASARVAPVAIRIAEVHGPHLAVVARLQVEVAGASLQVARIQRAGVLIVTLHVGGRAALSRVAGVDGTGIAIVASLHRAEATPACAGVADGADVVVVARRGVDTVDAGSADASVVGARIGVRASLDHTSASAGGAADVIVRAGVVVVAGVAHENHMRAHAADTAKVRRAGIVVVASLGRAFAAQGLVADVVRAEVAIIAGHAGKGATAGRVAGIGGAGVAVGASAGDPGADAEIVARVIDGAGVAVRAHDDHIDVDAGVGRTADVRGADVAVVAGAAAGGGRLDVWLGLRHVGAAVGLGVVGTGDAGVDVVVAEVAVVSHPRIEARSRDHRGTLTSHEKHGSQDGHRRDEALDRLSVCTHRILQELLSSHQPIYLALLHFADTAGSELWFGAILFGCFGLCLERCTENRRALS